MRLHPGGRGDSAKGIATLDLINRSNKAIDIEFRFSVIDRNGKQVAFFPTKLLNTDSVQSCSVGGYACDRRWTALKKRSNLLGSLVNGALVIEVDMRLAKRTKTVSLSPPFIPENPSSCVTVIEAFLDEKYSDIVLEVGRDHTRKDHAMKVAKTTRRCT